MKKNPRCDLALAKIHRLYSLPLPFKREADGRIAAAQQAVRVHACPHARWSCVRLVRDGAVVELLLNVLTGCVIKPDGLVRGEDDVRLYFPY